MKPRVPALLLSALLAPELRAASNDARFAGGAFDGHAAAARIAHSAPGFATDRFHGGVLDGSAAALDILFSAPPAVSHRFAGGVRDGHAAVERVAFSVPPSATDRFHGGGLDGHALSALLAFDTAMLVARFRGSAYDGHAAVDRMLHAPPASDTDRFRGGDLDGHVSSASGPLPNPLDADTDGDGLPDWFEIYFRSVTAAVPGLDQDGDGQTAWEEFVAMTHPDDPSSYWRLTGMAPGDTNVLVYFLSSAGRSYALESTTNIVGGIWAPHPGQTNHPGLGGPNPDSLGSPDAFTVPAGVTQRFYRARVFRP